MRCWLLCTSSTSLVTLPPTWSNTTQLWLHNALLQSCSTFPCLIPTLHMWPYGSRASAPDAVLLAAVVPIPIAILSCYPYWSLGTKWAFTISPRVRVILLTLKALVQWSFVLAVLEAFSVSGNRQCERIVKITNFTDAFLRWASVNVFTLAVCLSQLPV